MCQPAGIKNAALSFKGCHFKVRCMLHILCSSCSVYMQQPMQGQYAAHGMYTSSCIHPPLPGEVRCRTDPGMAAAASWSDEKYEERYAAPRSPVLLRIV
jgi:hypothetical protein